MSLNKTKLLDGQKYMECQLIAVINAAAYLGEPLVDPESEEYERLVDLVGARHGSAINIRLAVSYLRLSSWPIESVTVDAVRTHVAAGTPTSVPIWHRNVGCHEVLLIEGKPQSVRALNLGIKGVRQGRLSWERLGELMAAVLAHNRAATWYELDPLKKRKR